MFSQSEPSSFAASTLFSSSNAATAASAAPSSSWTYKIIFRAQPALTPSWFKEMEPRIMGLLLLLLITVGFLLELLRKKNQQQQEQEKKKLRLPPGPRGWPLIGNLLQTSPIPHEKMLEMNRKFGPVVYLKLGRVPAIVTDDPSVVKAILKSQDGLFASRPSSIASQYFTYGGKDIAFAPYGSHWRAMRRVCTLQLLAPKRLEKFKQGRREEIGLMLMSVYESSGAVGMRDLFGGLASNNLARMLLGKRFFGAGLTGPGDAAEHRSMIYEAFGLVNAFNVGDYLPFLRWFDVQGHEKKMKRIMRRTNVLYDAVIHEHACKKTADRLPADHPDSKFVDVLLAQGLSQTVIKAILIDMAAAGTDTSSITSEWTMAELLRHPSILSKVRQEIESVIGGVHRLVEEDDVKHLHYLRAVVKEVLRLHPVGAFLIPHVSIQETELAGFHIPENTRALINTYSLGRNPAVWESPLEFRPERFVGEDLESLFDPQYRMVPFGAGRRGCPGAALGTCVILFGVASMVHAFEWKTVDGGEVDVKLAFNSVILEKPLELCASPRLAQHLYVQ